MSDISELLIDMCRPMPANLVEYPLYFAHIIRTALVKARDEDPNFIIKDVGPSRNACSGSLTRIIEATDINNTRYRVTIETVR